MKELKQGWEYPKCNICGSNNLDIIIDNVQDKATNLVECVDCNLRFFSPRPHWNNLKQMMWFDESNSHNMINEASNLYNNGTFFGEVKDPDWQKLAVENYYREMFRKIHKIADVKIESLLEIGCSIGRFMKVCSEFGIKNDNIFGVDINKYSIDVAREKFGFSNVYAGDFLEYSTDKVFDLVVMLDYIEHTYYPSQDIKKAVSYLKDSGLFVLKTFLEDLDPEHKMMLPPCHAYHFYGDVLYKLLRKNGLRVLHWEVEFMHQQVFIIAKKEL